jgi:hypothetical protein
VKFDQVIKHNFDQTPKLLETFDQLIWSSEIRSSDHFPLTNQGFLNNFVIVDILVKHEFIL